MRGDRSRGISGNLYLKDTIRKSMPFDPQRALKPLRKLARTLSDPSRDLTLEGVHDLRRQCYRVESMMSAFALDSERKGAQLLETIEPIRKKTGEMRFEITARATQAAYALLASQISLQ